MTDADQTEHLTEIQVSSLARVIDILKFAEAKNAALLAFSSAWLLAVIGLLSRPWTLPQALVISLVMSIPLLSIAATIAIWALLPKRKISLFHHDPDQPKNLLFYGDIATFDPAAYTARVTERYLDTGKNYLDDLAIQIAVNSKIANRKFSAFNIGGLFVFAALLILAVAAIIELVRWFLAGTLV